MESKTTMSSESIKLAQTTGEDIVCRVKVDRKISPGDAINEVCRLYWNRKLVDNEIVAAMPDGRGEEVEVVFFRVLPSEFTDPKFPTYEDIARAYERRGLVPDPRAQAKVHEWNQPFARYCPNATLWKDGDRYNFSLFCWANDWEPTIQITFSDGIWNNWYRIAGVRR